MTGHTAGGGQRGETGLTARYSSNHGSLCLPLLHAYTFNQPKCTLHSLHLHLRHMSKDLKWAVKPWWTASNDNGMIKQLCQNNVWENGTKQGATCSCGSLAFCCLFYPTFPFSLCFLNHTHGARSVQQDDVEIIYRLSVLNALQSELPDQRCLISPDIQC